MNSKLTRRSFVRSTLLSSAGLALAVHSKSQAVAADAAPGASATLPKGKIGKLEVSRMLLGGNLLTHFTHSRDLQVRLYPGRPLQHRREDHGDAGRGRGQRHQYRLDAQPAAPDFGPAALPQGARRQDPVDHLPHGGRRAGHGQVPRSKSRS